MREKPPGAESHSSSIILCVDRSKHVGGQRDHSSTVRLANSNMTRDAIGGSRLWSGFSGRQSYCPGLRIVGRCGSAAFPTDALICLDFLNGLPGHRMPRRRPRCTAFWVVCRWFTFLGDQVYSILQLRRNTCRHRHRHLCCMAFVLSG